MKIATFNANSIRARLPIIVPWLQKHQPDALGIQETKAQDKDFPDQAFKDIGYLSVFKGQKSYNGVALLSRVPLKNVRSGFAPDDELNGPRLIRGTLGDVHIINAYVPQGRDIESEHYSGKLEWLKRFKELLEDEYRPDQKVIWMGDLNVAPEPKDVHDPKRLDGHVCFNKELSALFYEVCRWGLKDVFRKHHPEPEQFSYFDYRVRGAVPRKIGWRIDHILATESLFTRSVDAWIDLEPRVQKLEKPSDHTLMIAEFDLG